MTSSLSKERGMEAIHERRSRYRPIYVRRRKTDFRSLHVHAKRHPSLHYSVEQLH